jgi:uncharacterized protein YggE
MQLYNPAEGGIPMNRPTRTLLSLLFVSLAVVTIVPPVAAAPTTPEARTITVTGDAEVRVPPDQVILTLGVETWDRDLATAKRQNDEIVSRTLKVAEDHGVAPQHVQTDYVSIEPRYRSGTYEPGDFIGYFVRKTIVITLRDIAQFEQLLSDALEAGVTHVHGIEFRTSELREHRDTARALAIRAAREKAIALASELDQTVGRPTDIREEYNGWWSPYNSWWGRGWGALGTAQNVIQETGIPQGMDATLAPGQITVNARVTVSFELE